MPPRTSAARRGIALWLSSARRRRERAGSGLRRLGRVGSAGFGGSVGRGILRLLVRGPAARPVAALGIILFPLAGLFLAIDEFLAPPTAPFPLDWQIGLHVIIALLAYSLLAIAAVLALLLATQEKALRTRTLNAWADALPPLTQTESLMFRLIGAGFALLTLTLLSGILFVHNLHAQHQAHTAILSLVAWIIFGVLLFGRWRWGWRGHRAVNLTLAGMAILLLAFFGSKFVLEQILHRHDM